MILPSDFPKLFTMTPEIRLMNITYVVHVLVHQFMVQWFCKRESVVLDTYDFGEN